METVLVQIHDNKAYRLLKDLEDLNVLKVIKQSNSDSQKLSEKFGCKLNLTDEEYNGFQKYLDETRKEWERDI